MAKVDYGFSLTEKALADSLEITIDRLDEIIAFFDSDPDDEWHLVEHEHYIFVNKKLQERLFSLMGAYVIAEYVRRTTKSTLLERFVEFITRHKTKVRESFVAGHIVRNCSSLVLWSNRHFLSKRDTVKILATSPARLNRSFQELQGANLMRKSIDFRDDEGVRYYSIRGLSRLADDLAKKLTSNERRYWCEAVKVTGEKTLKLIASEEDNRRIRIDKACELAKKRDKRTCQVTGNKNEKTNKICLVAHHLYSKSHFRHLEASLDNLITLDSAIHAQFHGWNGGKHVLCTPDLFIQFVQQHYPDQSARVAIIVERAKQGLGEQPLL